MDNHAVCSCQTGFVGTPPNCKHECVVSAECPLTQACLNNKCRDPCPGTCGQGARCQVVNHNPICSCPSGLTGDPFSRCYPVPGKFICNKVKHIMFYTFRTNFNIIFFTFTQFNQPNQVYRQIRVFRRRAVRTPNVKLEGNRPRVRVRSVI